MLETNKNIDPKAPYFVPSDIEENFGGRKNILRSKSIIKACFETFIKTVDERMNTLRHAIESGDKKTIELMSHQLKGTFLTIGSKFLAQPLAEMELKSNSASKEELNLLFQKVGKYIPDLKTKLIQFLEEIN